MNNNHVVVLKCEQQCDILSLRKSRQNVSRSFFYVGMFKSYALFCPFFYAFFLPSFTVILFSLSIIFPLLFLKLFPFFLECLRRSTFFPLRHGQKKYHIKRDDTEHGEDKGGGGKLAKIETKSKRER